MHLTFSPAINEASPLVCSTSFHNEDQSASAQELVFKAAFDSRASFEQAKADGVRVEMWTDLPVEGRTGWEWGALAFRELGKSVSHAQSGQKVLSLLLHDEQNTLHSEEHALYAKLHVRLHEYTPGHRFHFTYRLVYPSGEIRWLGEYGRNGVLVLERTPIPAVKGVHLSEGWNVGLDGQAEYKAISTRESVVGKLHGEFEWSSWAVKGNSWAVFSPKAEAQSSSAIILFPRSRRHAIIAPQALVLCATHGASVQISSGGTISSKGDGHLLLSSIDRASFRPVDGSGITLLHVDESDAPCLIVASQLPDGGLPVSLLFIPLLLRTVHQNVYIPGKALASLLPDATRDSFAICSPTTHGFYTPTDEVVTLHMSQYGGSAILAPAYTLVATDGEVKESWNISLMHQYMNAEVVESRDEISQRVLPTPPPSPPPVHRTAANRPAVFPLPSLSEVSEQFSSVTSSTVSSPAQTPAVSSTPFEPPVAESLTPFISSTAYAHDDEMNPDRHALMRVHGSHPLQVYLQILLATFAALWQALLQKLALLWVGLGGAQVVPSTSLVILNQSESGENTDAGRLEPKGSSEGEHSTAVEDACVPLDGDSGDERTKPAESATDLIERPAPEPSVSSPSATFLQRSISYPEARDPSTMLKLAKSTFLLSADICNVDGEISVLVQGHRGLHASPSALKFSLGGEQILEPGFSDENGDGCYLVHLGPPPGFRSGNLTVTFA